MSSIILASQSPRRKQLMEMAELAFEIIIADVDETNPEGMPGALVPAHLAQKKANAIAHQAKGKIIIAADTIVLIDNAILGKPKDEAHAIDLLTTLAGRTHEVITGVCVQQDDHQEVFSVTTEVFFRKLTPEQIAHYVRQYKPYDKAGAYAIQEWIGAIGIEKINGDYYNVMGLPIGALMECLRAHFGHP